MSIHFFGTALIYSALGVALLQCLLPLAGYWRKNNYLLALTRPCALLQSFLIANAFLLLIVAFVSNDFSIAYVAKNSHPSLPFFYRLTAVWGAHEGSFLLWIFLLDAWTAAICFFSGSWEREVRDLSLALLGLISFCFLLFLSQTSDPFLPGVSAVPQDLNPLLQDPGFFVHPPMLYAGYVGFSAVFAITMAYLLRGTAGTEAGSPPSPTLPHKGGGDQTRGRGQSLRLCWMLFGSRGGNQPLGLRRGLPPSPTLPHKGGGDQTRGRGQSLRLC